MKKFIKNSILFSCLLLVINAFVYVFIAKKVIYNKYIIEEIPSHCNKILLSDSHGAALGNSELNKRGIYNFSFDSDSYIDMLAKLDFLIDNCTVDSIFISADDHTLSHFREIKNNLNRSVYYVNFKNYTKYYGDNILSFIYDKYLSYYLPLSNTNNSRLIYLYLKQQLFSSAQKINKRSSINRFTKNELKKICKKRKKQQFPYIEKSSIMKKALIDIIKKCKNNEIELIGIKFPLSRQYLKTLNSISYGADKILDSKDITIFDYKEKLSDHKYFYDEDHLNLKGKSRFIKILCN